MRASPKIKRITLDISDNNEWILFGLVTTEPDYKLSLTLNNKFRISLRNTTPVTISDENDNEFIFSRFSNSSNSPGMICELTSNHSGKISLIKKIKNIDYFLLIHDIYKEIKPGDILSILRETDCITAAFKLDPDMIKDRNLKYIINQI